MPANSYRLPIDNQNTGVRIRTFQRTIGTAQEENYFHEAQCETSAVTNTPANAANVTLLAANQQRQAVYIHNDSEDSELLVKCGATASATSFTFIIPPREGRRLPVPWAGIIDGIWRNPGGGAVIGNARVTEITP